MTEAKAVWIDEQRFVAEASSGHGIVVDGDHKTGNSPMELVLIGLCGCTGYDVASILKKKREPFLKLEVRAEAERAAEVPKVYTSINWCTRSRERFRVSRWRMRSGCRRRSIALFRRCWRRRRRSRQRLRFMRAREQ